jgi:hypothetical protein
MRARDFLRESKPQPDIHAIVKKFLPFVQQQLELSDLPEIELLNEPLKGTFGRYSDGNIRVMAHGRHPIDVLRTLAHELVHYKQDSEGRIHDDSGETGSDEENEANAVAGIIMRDFDQANPELLAALKESQQHDVSKKSSTVTAHGYEYNRQDQRIAWTRDFASETAAKEWARRRNATVLSIVPKTDMTEGKITLSTDPDWYGATIDNYKATGPVIDISADQLVGFEPDDKMDQPKSKENVKKIVSGLKKGDKLPPLLVRKYKKGYQVLDGHHRFWAYKSLGVKSIPVQVVPATDIEEKGRQDMAEGAMSDLDLDIQDEHWDGIVGYVIHGLKTGISPGRMELYLYKWAGQEMFDLDEELQGRGFGSLYELVDHIQEHGGKYVNPTFDLDGLFGDDEISENFKDGKNPQDKGDSKRHGINTKASVSSLRKTAKSGGRKGQLAHWLANMKAGRAKKK